MAPNGFHSEPVRGEQLAEGKTKIVYAVQGDATQCILYSKDRITANNATK